MVILAVILAALTACQSQTERHILPIDYGTSDQMKKIIIGGPATGKPTTLAEMIAAAQRAQESIDNESLESMAARDNEVVRALISSLSPNIRPQLSTTLEQFNQRGTWPCGIWSGDFTFFQRPLWLDNDSQYVDHCVISSGGSPRPNTWLVVGLSTLEMGSSLTSIPNSYQPTYPSQST